MEKPDKAYDGIRVIKSEGISHNKVADKILSEHDIIYSAHNYYEYTDGLYLPIEEERVKKYIKDTLEEDYSKHEASEVLNSIQTEKFISIHKLNNTRYLNLKNGMFDLDERKLYLYSPRYLSTIRLNVTYEPDSWCRKWIDTLCQIFEGDENKISTIQEFFGLCLTREVKYEKALLLIGEGANGKSTILYILENLLGEKNRSAVPLEKLNNSHYIANLFGKLVNISIETNAKSEVYDAMFKAIVSGDTVTADQKFRPPFEFRPYCKLIYALNNMPRVDDKTSAFFRRLLIVRFNRQFDDSIANKNLKYELLQELDGIFLWALEGLRNLWRRGYFAIDRIMEAEIKEYKRENNNVLVFVDEECRLDGSISKQTLYSRYSQWCKDNGHGALSKIRFGKELLKHYNTISEDRSSALRTWVGINAEI